mmetsp:Transcript_80686/g.152492  ORF Transcript_80686/g.152492 Transcript_80686/m.152492 type:complete len:876 (+) Transcript_80686:76-2703(+)
MVHPTPMMSLIFFFLQVSTALSQACSSGAEAQSKVFVDDLMSADSNLMMLQVRSSEKHSDAAGAEDFEAIGVGCCGGSRDADGGKLWAGPTADLATCKSKCREFKDCGAVEYGWTFNAQWCFVWSDKQACSSLEVGQGKCGQGGSDGVQVYKMSKNVIDDSTAILKETTLKAAVEAFEAGGVGCCSGDRDEAHGKLWAGPAPDLITCKSMCLKHKNCGAVEYGWTFNAQWCFIWSDSQACSSLEAGEGKCGSGGSDGVQVYKIKKSARHAVHRMRIDTGKTIQSTATFNIKSLDPKMKTINKEELSLEQANHSPIPSSFGVTEAAPTQLHKQLSGDFETVGSGCCVGIRDKKNGKLWSGSKDTLDGCKAKCREFDNCGVVEFGWTWNAQWCFIWDTTQECRWLEAGEGKCGTGGSDGVQAYRFQKSTSMQELNHPVSKDTKEKALREAKEHAEMAEEKRKKQNDAAAKTDEKRKKQSDAAAKAVDKAKAQKKQAEKAHEMEVAYKHYSPAAGILAYKEETEGSPQDPNSKSGILAETDAGENTAEDFETVGAGCCSGARNTSNGKLWSGPERNLAACQAKCRQFKNCGVVEYGWSSQASDHKFCFIWSSQQKCAKLDVGSGKCGTGGSDGVHAYRLKASRSTQLKDTEQVSQDFDRLGSGCCSGAREPKTGKLWAGPQRTLEACQAKCREHDDCGFVEYGWNGASSDHQFCFIWSKQQKCSSLDKGPGKCGPAGSDGVQAYKYKKDASTKVAKKSASEPVTKKKSAKVPKRKETAELHDNTKLGWMDLGAGCCKGARSTKDAMLLVELDLPSLNKCKQLCSDISNCGAVEWVADEDTTACYLWTDKTDCSELEVGKDCGVHDAFHSVRTYQFNRQ